MRVSTMQMNNTMQYNMMSSTAAMNETLMQLSTGKRVNSPSDDVLASTQIMGMNDELAQLSSYETNIMSAQNSLSMAEAVITDMVDIMNSMRDLVLAIGGQPLPGEEPVQPLPDDGNDLTQTPEPTYPVPGGDPTQPIPDEGGNSNIDPYLQELEMLVDALADLGNTKGASGEYIFGGTEGDKQPIDEIAMGEYEEYIVGGGDEVRDVQISDSQSVEIGVTASDLFTLDSGESIFGVMDDFIEGMSDPNITEEEADQLIEDTLMAIDETLDNMNQALTQIGASMNTLERAANTNSEMQLYNDMMVGGLEDLDYASAITEFNLQQLQLQASQSAFAMVNSSTLFDYM